MAKEVEIYKNDDMIPLEYLDTLMKNNAAKFYNYVNQHELLRLRFVLTTDTWKYLKTWIHAVDEDIISLKSQFAELNRLYEVLLENNFIKEFLDYTNSQEILQLKLVETILEKKCLKTNMDFAVAEVASLKSEYDNLTRNYEELSKNSFAKEFLNFAKPKEALQLKIGEKIDECRRLELCLDTACLKLIMLNSELDKLIRRYHTLSDDDNVREFMDEAKRQDALRSKCDEKVDACNCSKLKSDQITTRISSLELQLTKARELLNRERLQRQKTESERDSTSYLSEGLCRLLSNYLDGKLPAEMDETSINGDPVPSQNSNVVESDSSSSPETSVLKSIHGVEKTNAPGDIENDYEIVSFEEEIIEQAVVKKEKTDHELSTDLVAPVNKPIELSNSHSNVNDSANEKNDAVESSSKSGPKSDTSNVQETASNRRSLRKRKLIELWKQTLPKVKPLPAKFFKQKITPEVVPRKPLTNDISDVSFCCDKCGKSFVVKPNERKPQNCPICEMKSANFRAAKKTVAGPQISTLRMIRNESQSTVAPDSITKAHVISTIDPRCNICGRRYARKSHVLRHIRCTHEKEIHFKCAECEKSFSKGSLLKNHVLLHSSPTVFSCNVCKKCFTSPESVRRHELVVHKGDVRYCCAHCDKRFCQKWNLRHHIQSKHLPGLLHRFKCLNLLCERSFKSDKARREHERIVHEENHFC